MTQIPNIRISVETQFIDQQSNVSDNRYVFAYRITIKNLSDKVCQLLSRHWIIEDANHKVEEVHGEGVVGKQPIIGPGKEYQYDSGAILETDLGTMEGKYFFIQFDDTGNITKEFDTLIPKFVLTVPRVLH